MALITIELNFHINNSVQVGDTLYFGATSTVGGVKTITAYNNIVKIGPVVNIRKIGRNKGFIVVDADTANEAPSAGNFLFFSKDNNVNLSSVLGYYAEVKMSNDATERAELFSIGTEMSPSSK